MLIEKFLLISYKVVFKKKIKLKKLCQCAMPFYGTINYVYQNRIGRSRFKLFIPDQKYFFFIIF